MENQYSITRNIGRGLAGLALIVMSNCNSPQKSGIDVAELRKYIAKEQEAEYVKAKIGDIDGIKTATLSNGTNTYEIKGVKEKGGETFIWGGPTDVLGLDTSKPLELYVEDNKGNHVQVKERVTILGPYKKPLGERIFEFLFLHD